SSWPWRRGPRGGEDEGEAMQELREGHEGDERGVPTGWRHFGSRRKHVEEENPWRRVNRREGFSRCSWLGARSSAVVLPTSPAGQAGCCRWWAPQSWWRRWPAS